MDHALGVFMRHSGFTLTEMMIVLVVVGVATAFGMPKISNLVYKTNARGARVAFANLAVKARSAAVQRGCTATLSFTTGAAGRVWVTVCKVGATGTDTLGGVEPLATRFGVSLSSTGSAVQYSPRGISMGYQALTMVFTATGGQNKDSTMLNQFGKVVR
jgi:prepilin-type N-terminal cleavage/methylation domain-containing protein